MTFDEQLRTTLQTIYRTPSASEARAIVDVARLAATADKRTDLSETVVLLAVTRIVCEMAGLTEAPPPSSIDARRLAEIGEQLVPIGARELAYACAFLVMVQDLDVTTEEQQMANALGEALALDPTRARHFAGRMEALVRAARK